MLTPNSKNISFIERWPTSCARNPTVLHVPLTAVGIVEQEGLMSWIRLHRDGIGEVLPSDRPVFARKDHGYGSSCFFCVENCKYVTL